MKRLLAKKSPLISSDLYVEIEKLKERNRQLRLKIGEERRSNIEKVSELEHRIENMMRRNQEKQARLDELEIQIKEVTDSKLQTEVGNLQTENETLRADYTKLLESSTHVTNNLRQEVQELRSQLKTERAAWEEVEKRNRAAIEAQRSQIKDLKRGYGLEPTHTENILRRQLADLQAELSDLKRKFVAARELPEAADLLNQLKTRRKKSSAALTDVEKILEIIGGDSDD